MSAIDLARFRIAFGRQHRPHAGETGAPAGKIVRRQEGRPHIGAQNRHQALFRVRNAPRLSEKFEAALVHRPRMALVDGFQQAELAVEMIGDRTDIGASLTGNLAQRDRAETAFGKQLLSRLEYRVPGGFPPPCELSDASCLDKNCTNLCMRLHFLDSRTIFRATPVALRPADMRQDFPNHLIFNAFSGLLGWLERMEIGEETLDLSRIEHEYGHFGMSHHDALCQRLGQMRHRITLVQRPECRSLGHRTVAFQPDGVTGRAMFLRDRLPQFDIRERLRQRGKGKDARKQGDESTL